ncbi:DNA-entry nuclease [Psychrobacillus sp. FSL K6-1464]|uniref:DNA-entry nuclease n=1 Tax=Psychrobacillus sp. FSL K6-1464 TaxID=2921545 RepID=UPI0030F83216
MQNNPEATPIEYDRFGQMKYHPEYHENHRKPFSEPELEYMCKYWHLDSTKTMSLALGKTETTISQKVNELNKSGLFQYYKNLNKHW